MATPTVVQIGHTHKPRLNLYKYELANVGTSATGSEEELADIAAQGRIKQIRCACNSTDFDLQIFNKTGGTVNTINEIFKTETENLLYDEYGLDVNYRNADTTFGGSLYAKVKNDDGGNATGTIYLEIYVEAYND